LDFFRIFSLKEKKIQGAFGCFALIYKTTPPPKKTRAGILINSFWFVG